MFSGEGEVTTHIFGMLSSELRAMDEVLNFRRFFIL